MTGRVAECCNDRRPMFRRRRRPRSIGHSGCGWCYISSGVWKRVLPHVHDLGTDSSGIAASSSRVQSGHVSHSSLLRGANGIAGEFPIALDTESRLNLRERWDFQIPGLLVEPILFTVIMYWLAGLRPAMDALGLTILVVIFTMNVSTACGKRFRFPVQIPATRLHVRLCKLSRFRIFLLGRLSERAAGDGISGTVRLRSYDNHGTFHQARVFTLHKFLLFCQDYYRYLCAS